MADIQNCSSYRSIFNQISGNISDQFLLYQQIPATIVLLFLIMVTIACFYHSYTQNTWSTSKKYLWLIAQLCIWPLLSFIYGIIHCKSWGKRIIISVITIPIAMIFLIYYTVATRTLNIVEGFSNSMSIVVGIPSAGPLLINDVISLYLPRKDYTQLVTNSQLDSSELNDEQLCDIYTELSYLTPPPPHLIFFSVQPCMDCGSVNPYLAAKLYKQLKSYTQDGKLSLTEATTWQQSFIKLEPISVFHILPEAQQQQQEKLQKNWSFGTVYD